MKKRFNITSLLPVILLCLALSACQTSSQLASSTDITIHRDQYGTPHIFANSNNGVYYGYGYAVASDRLYQMEILKRTTQGRVAQVLGKDYLDLDRHIRTHYDLPSVRRQVQDLPLKDKQLLQAYADGFNHRIDQVLKYQELLPLEFVQNQFMPEHWSAEDVAMIFIGSIIHRYADFNSELDNLQLLKSLIKQHGDTPTGRDKAWAIFNASKWLWDNDSPVTVRSAVKDVIKNAQTYSLPTTLLELTAGISPQKAAYSQRVVLDRQGRFAGITKQLKARQLQQSLIAENGFSSQTAFTGASNFWAVNGDKLKDGEGAFVNGPQFGWAVPSYVYGVGLHGGDFDVVGNTLLALPAMLFAHNNHIGWGSTAGLSDLVDVFAVRLNPENPNQYWHNGKYRDMKSWNETIAVKGQPDITVTARKTVYGMVVAQENKLAYSRARTWEGREVATLMAWIELAKIKSIKQAQKILSGVASNINFYLMDRVGNLGYTHGGVFPKRHPQQDSRLPTFSGGASDGTGEEQLDWQGMRPFSDNPSSYIAKTESGYLMNWNNRPQSSWRSSDLWPFTWGTVDRGAILEQRLLQHESFSTEQLWLVTKDIAYKDLSLPFLLPYLQEAIQFCRTKDDKNQHQSLLPLAQQALQQLEQWSQDWIADEQGEFGSNEAIMDAWIKQLLAMVFKDDVGEKFALYAGTNHPSQPLGASKKSPLGVRIIVHQLEQMISGEPIAYDFFNNAEPAHILADSFMQALAKLTQQSGADMTQWRLTAAPMHWNNINFRGVPQADINQQVKLPVYMNRGSENNLFIANGKGFIAYDVIPAGQKGMVSKDGEASKHYHDQIELFKQYKYKTVPFTRQQVEAISISVKKLTEPLPR